MSKNLEKYERSLEQIFLEMYGYGARFEKLEMEIQSLRDRLFDLENKSNILGDDYDTMKSKLIESAQDCLTSAFFSAVYLVDELENVTTQLADAHESIFELTKTLKIELDEKSNDEKARKSAFNQL